MARQVGGETALVPDRGRHAALLQQALQRVEHLGAAAQRVAKALRADWNDHELLHVQAVVGVGAAVDDVHHRHRHLHSSRAAEVAVQRQPALVRRGLGHGHGHGQHRIGAQARLVFRAVEIDQRLVDEALLGRIEAHDGF